MTDPLEHATEVSISAGRKVQLERYEPINEQATITLDLSEVDSAEEKREIIRAAEDEAWDTCEEGVMRRYEEHVREEAFGEEDDD